MGGIVAVLVGLAFGYYYLILDWQGRPFCHKQVYMSFRIWMDDRNTNAFPNVAGAGKNSLGEIREEMVIMDWADKYKYVPGLREGDPGDLVLMYLDRPTRWTWHGPPPTVFEKKAWIIVPVDFKAGERQQAGPGEMSERVSLDEFRNRLRRTLDFIRTNERPHWQAVVSEHTKFLDSIDSATR